MTCRESAALPAIASEATPAPFEIHWRRALLPQYSAGFPVSILCLLRRGTTAETQAFPFRNRPEHLPMCGLQCCSGSARLRSERSYVRDRFPFGPHSIIQCAESFLPPVFA